MNAPGDEAGAARVHVEQGQRNVCKIDPDAGAGAVGIGARQAEAQPLLSRARVDGDRESADAQARLAFLAHDPRAELLGDRRPLRRRVDVDDLAGPESARRRDRVERHARRASARDEHAPSRFARQRLLHGPEAVEGVVAERRGGDRVERGRELDEHRVGVWDSEHVGQRAAEFGAGERGEPVGR